MAYLDIKRTQLIQYYSMFMRFHSRCFTAKISGMALSHSYLEADKRTYKGES